MSWHLLEKALDEISKQSTFFGKIWITSFFILRVIPLTRMGESVYGDEQAAFKCNVKQLGCENVCFNQYSPISPIRFWGFQMVMVVTPPIMFLIYASHTIVKISSRSQKKTGFLTKQQLLKLESSLLISRKQTNSTQNEDLKQNENLKISQLKRSLKLQQMSCDSQTVDLTTKESPNAAEQKNKFKKTTFSSATENSHTLYEIIPLKQIPQRAFEKEENRHAHARGRREQNTLYRAVSLSRIRLYSEDRFDNSLPSARFKKSRDRMLKAKPTSSSLAPVFSVSSLYQESDLFGAGLDQKEEVSEEKLLKYCRVKKRNLGEEIQFVEVASQLNSLKRKTSSSSLFPLSNYECRKINKEYPHKEDCLSPKSNFVDNRIGKVQKFSAMSPQQLREMKKIKIKKGFQNIALAYFMQCLLRLSLDSGFAYLQYQFFRFEVPALYQCERWPCPNKVDCYISRPNEKSFMLHFMFSSAAISVFLSLCEIVFLCIRHYKQWLDRKRKEARTNSRRNRSDEQSADNQKTSKTDKKKNGHVMIKNTKDGPENLLLKTVDAESSENASVSFNSGELSAMLENELDVEILDENEEQNNDGDDFD